jgi:hypothetical protein
MVVQKKFVVKVLDVQFKNEEDLHDENIVQQYVDRFNQLGVGIPCEDVTVWCISPVLNSMQAAEEWRMNFHGQGPSPNEFIDIEIYEIGQAVKVIRSSRYY